MFEDEYESIVIHDSENFMSKRIYDSLFKQAFIFTKINELDSIHFISGNHYYGSLSKNKLFGQGVYSWLDGVIYSGCFENNKMQNYGRFKYPGDFKYFGDMKDNYWDGYGRIEFKDFNFKGHFRKGIAGGYASCLASSNTFNGIMYSDKPKYGVRKYNNSTFKGHFDSFGCRSKGKLTFDNTDTYEGNWHSDMFGDFGIYIWRNITEKYNFMISNGSYVGFWMNGMRHGVGKVEFQDRFICCMWKNDEKQGPGIVVAANGGIFASTHMFLEDNYMKGNRIRRCKEVCDLINEISDLCEKQYSNEDFGIKPCPFESESSFDFFNPSSCQSFYDFAKDLESRDSWQTQTYNCSQNKLLPRSEIFSLKINELVGLYTEQYDEQTNALFVSSYEIDELILKPWIFQIIRQHFIKYSTYTIYENELLFLCEMLKDTYGLRQDLYDVYTTLNKNVHKSCHHRMTRLGLWIFYENVFVDTKYNISELIIEADNLFGITGSNEKHWNPFYKVYFWEFNLHILYIVNTINANPFVFKFSIKAIPTFYGTLATMVLLFLRQHQFMEPKLNDPTSDFLKNDFEKAYRILFKIKAEAHPLTLRTAFQFLKENFITDDYYSSLSEIIESKFKVYGREFKNFQLTPLQLLELILKCIYFVR